MTSPKLYLTNRIDLAYAHMLARLKDQNQPDPFAGATILLPSVGVIDDVRRRLGDSIGIQIIQFHSLGQQVLTAAGSSVQRISETAVRWLIRSVLKQMAAAGELNAFSVSWVKPGFLQVVLDWIREMKGQGITPGAYDAYAHDHGGEKDIELAGIYCRFQDFMLQRGYSDSDGLLWLAADALEEEPLLYISADPLYILGFDQFTPVQLRILKALASRSLGTHIYLLWDQNRSQRSLPMVRLSETRMALQTAIPLQVEKLSNEAVSAQAPVDLEKLHRHLFDLEMRENHEARSGRNETVERVGEDHPTGGEGSGGLLLVEAPSPESEVRWALREVKRLLISGTSPLDVAVLAVNRNTYLPIVRTIAAEYGLPVDLDLPLSQNPAVNALAALLRLPDDFPWAETFSVLRSPYIRQVWLDEEQLDALDRLSRERPVIAGREQWEFALQPLALDHQAAEDEDLGPPPLVATIPEQELVQIRDRLFLFFDTVKPPERANYRDYTWWLQKRLLGFSPDEDQNGDTGPDEPTLDLLCRCYEGPDPRRDVGAIQDVMNVLRRLLKASEIMAADAVVDWESYRDDVLGLLSVSKGSRDLGNAGIRFEAIEGARGRVVDHLFVLGLSEGEFPSAPAPDPLYSPLERELHPLPLIRFSPANDASLWWQAIGGVRERLTLLRPYIDQHGAPWGPSPYWDAVQEILGPKKPHKIPIASSPKLQDAAAEAELLTALCRDEATLVPQALREKWEYAIQAEAIINQRQSYKPAAEFEGVFRSGDLKHELTSRYGEGHIWSASRLNRYANCPYGFFAEQLLKLQPYQDPQEGMDVMQRGSLLHAILEHLYRKLAETSLEPTLDNLQEILGELSASCAVIFPQAPQRYGFRPGALWEYEKKELQRLLSALVAWECEGNGSHARFTPYLLEAMFGINFEGTPPLTIDMEDIRFRLRGVVDRVDRDDRGNLRVIDYKSGSTSYSKPDMQRGLGMQTALYALVAEQNWLHGAGRVAESHYWLIPSRSTSGTLTFDGQVREDEVAESIIRRAAWCVEMVRSGYFPSAPAKPYQWGRACSNSCDFAAICRVSRQSIAKAWVGAES